jgi:hypothetical protein
LTEGTEVTGTLTNGETEIAEDERRRQLTDEHGRGSGADRRSALRGSARATDVNTRWRKWCSRLSPWRSHAAARRAARAHPSSPFRLR